MMKVSGRSQITADLPGVGGRIKGEYEDFVVEEIPLYELSGEGEHIFLWVEKRGMTGGAAIERLSAHFGVPRSEIGMAGIKDKFAVTRQWFSMPRAALSSQDGMDAVDGVGGGIGAASSVQNLVGEVDAQLVVLEAMLHQNKLRTGHLAGNRFRVVIRDLAVPGDVALQRAQAILEALKTRGVPNYYGPQRFGNDGDTLALGIGFLSGDIDAQKQLARARRLRRLAVSAVQSELFNRVLSHRMRHDLLRTVLEGDVLKKTDTGGVFWVPAEEVDECQARLERGELGITGPMPGAKMFKARGASAALEAEVFADSGFDVGLLAREKRLARGTRRPLLINPWLNDPAEFGVELAREGGRDMLILRFSLPAGSYATILLSELIEQNDDA